MRDVRIGVFGASGFVGSTVCERLFFDRGWQFTAFIHSTGNAARIARLPIAIRTVDLTQAAEAEAAAGECEVIVNCSRGDDSAMRQGLKNLLRGARRKRVRKFIHLSSVMIYGPDPGPDSVSESGKPAPAGNEYGLLKLWQDEAVLRLHRQGVPSYILCPGNIIGPYSTFVADAARRLASGPMPLVDGGRYATNLVHVENVVEAILTAVRAGEGAGERYFVNEERPVSWRELFEHICRTFDVRARFVDVPREEVVRALAPVEERRRGLGAYVRSAASANTRRALASAVPGFGWVNRQLAGALERLPRGTYERLKHRLQWPVQVAKASAGLRLDERLVLLQARRFYHSPEKLRRLGYRPAFTYEQGMDSIFAWMRFAGVP